MALPSSGRISLSQVATQFGLSAPYAVSALYDDKICYAPTSSNVIPTSGNSISLSKFYGKANVVPSLSALSASGSSNARGVYATSRLSKAYTGPILELVLYSNSAVANVYSDANGVRGLSFNGRGTSLASWMGAGNASVRTWYDQSGSGRHAVQANVALAPTILTASSSNTIYFRSSCFLSLPDNTGPLGDSNYTLVAKHGTATGTLLGLGVAGQYKMNCMILGAGQYTNDWFSSQDIAYSTPAANNRVVMICAKGIGRSTYVNNVMQSNMATTIVHLVDGMSNFVGKADYPFAPFVGQLYHLHVYGSALSTADRTAVGA